MGNESSDKEYECPSTSELPENKLRHNFLLGDMTWIKNSDSSWWPAQVIDEACVSTKPKKKGKHDCLVRLYGTCQYLYVDPWKSNEEFKVMLKQECKSAKEVFRGLLEKELSRVNSSSDYDEEGESSEGTQTKVTTEKASSRKGRKQELLKQCSYKGVKKAVTAGNLEDGSEDQDQEVGSTATYGVSVQKGKRRRGKKSSSSHDTAQTTDKGSCDNSAENSRGKRLKKVARVLDKEGCKIGASVVRREGLRRSTRASAKEYFDAAVYGTVSLTDTGASEDAVEDSMVDGTSGSHTEIKAMVRDILFKEIIDREHNAEMAYVDEVINGIYNSTMDSMTGGATATSKCGQGIENGTGVEGESSNVTQRDRKGKSDQDTEDTMQVTSLETRNHTTKNINSKNGSANSLKEVIDTTPSRDAAMKELEQLSPRQIRQIRIMQNLGLMAPSGSPFGKTGLFAAIRQ